MRALGVLFTLIEKQNECKQIFEYLEESLMIFKNGKIDLVNDMFLDLFKDTFIIDEFSLFETEHVVQNQRSELAER